jgi:hypothetical protein
MPEDLLLLTISKKEITDMSSYRSSAHVCYLPLQQISTYTKKAVATPFGQGVALLTRFE